MFNISKFFSLLDEKDYKQYFYSNVRILELHSGVKSTNHFFKVFTLANDFDVPFYISCPLEDKELALTSKPNQKEGFCHNPENKPTH